MVIRPLSADRLRTLALVLSLGGAAPLVAIDGNGDGYDDLWQMVHGVSLAEFPPTGDLDGDGISNSDESRGGTDPRDAGDRFRIHELVLSEETVRVTFETVAGKDYRVHSAESPDAASWTPEGAVEPGTGSLGSVVFARESADRRFYQVSISDRDSDGDGSPDWHESLTGTDPDTPNSPGNASGGAFTDGEALRGLLGLGFEIVEAEALEAPATDGILRLTRSDTTASLILPLALGGALDPKKGSASPSDYTLDGAGGESLVLPAGVAQHEIRIQPVADSLVEVPEALRFQIARPGLSAFGGDFEAEVKIRDRPSLEENQRLFVAYLTPIDGVDSSASGVVTAMVEGDNDRAIVSLTFSNLSSDQNTAYVRVGEDLEVARIPNGQVFGFPWSLRAAHFLTTDQATLDALENGSLYVSVSSANFPGGEIRGTLQPAEGSIAEPPPPEDPPDYGSEGFPNLATGGTEDNPELDQDIARFLMQASFGPSVESIGEVRAFVEAAGDNALAGYEAWIDDQIANAPNPSLKTLVEAADIEDFILRGNKPVTFSNDPQFGGNSFQFNATTRNWDPGSIHQNNYPFETNRRREWWTLVLNSRAQLRQRMAFALSEIVVISENDVTVDTHHYGAANYWDMLAANAFGPYRDLLEDVTYSPMMGVYLSHLKNQKQSGSISPDENYAREIMQLFSIGLVQRHLDGTLKLDPVTVQPIPTYDQGDITEMARVMTGLSFGKFNATVTGAPTYPNPTNQAIGAVQTNTNFLLGGNGHRFWQARWTNPMRMFSAYHDFNAYTAYTGLPLPEGVPSASKILFRDKPGQKVIPPRSASEANGNLDLVDALNALAGSPGGGAWDGHPNTPVFVSRLLIQRFTSSNPSRGYLHRVASVFRDSKGDLGEVVKAILLDHEARTLPGAGAAARGKAKEPILHFTAMLRGLGAHSLAPLANLATMPVAFTTTEAPVTTPYPASELAKFPAGATRFRFFDTDATLTQSPQRAPSVFNWFLPDYVVPGPLAAAGLVAPELQVATESNVINVINSHYVMLFSRSSPVAISAREEFTGFAYGRGVDNFFNLSNYQTAGGVQRSVPAYGLPEDGGANPGGRGYFERPQFDENATFVENNTTYRENPDSINEQLDNLLFDQASLFDRYTDVYEASLFDQYGGSVPASPGTPEKNLAHDTAAEVLLDHFDVLFAAGELKARFGGSTGDSPRQAILDALASGYVGSRNVHTNDVYNFENNVVARIKNLAYLVATSPQALILR